MTSLQVASANSHQGLIQIFHNKIMDLEGKQVVLDNKVDLICNRIPLDLLIQRFPKYKHNKLLTHKIIYLLGLIITLKNTKNPQNPLNFNILKNHNNNQISLNFPSLKT